MTGSCVAQHLAPMKAGPSHVWVRHSCVCVRENLAVQDENLTADRAKTAYVDLFHDGRTVPNRDGSIHMGVKDVVWAASSWL